MDKYKYDVVCVTRSLSRMDYPGESLTDTLVKKVQRMLDEGWELQGGVTISYAYDSMMAAQAIRKKK